MIGVGEIQDEKVLDKLLKMGFAVARKTPVLAPAKHIKKPDYSYVEGDLEYFYKYDEKRPHENKLFCVAPSTNLSSKEFRQAILYAVRAHENENFFKIRNGKPTKKSIERLAANSDNEKQQKALKAVPEEDMHDLITWYNSGGHIVWTCGTGYLIDFLKGENTFLKLPDKILQEKIESEKRPSPTVDIVEVTDPDSGLVEVFITEKPKPKPVLETSVVFIPESTKPEQIDYTEVPEVEISDGFEVETPIKKPNFFVWLWRKILRLFGIKL